MYYFHDFVWTWSKEAAGETAQKASGFVFNLKGFKQNFESEKKRSYEMAGK